MFSHFAIFITDTQWQPLVKLSSCEITHSVIVPKLFFMSVCFFLSLSSLSPWGCKTGMSLGPLFHLCVCNENKVPSNLLAAGIKACGVCQSTFLFWMQVLNSYLQLHIAAIMLTAPPNHKTHTQSENTHISKPTRLLSYPTHLLVSLFYLTHISQTYSLYL